MFLDRYMICIWNSLQVAFCEIYRGQSLITDLSKSYSIVSKTLQGHSSIDLTHIGLLFVLGKYALRSFEKSNAKFFNRTYTVCYVMLNKKVVLLHHKKVKRIIFSHKTRQVTYFNLRLFKMANHTRIRKTYFRPWFKLHNCILRHEGKLQYNEYK